MVITTCHLRHPPRVKSTSVFCIKSYLGVPALGIAVVVTLVLAVPVGVALGCSGMWCLMKSQGYKRDRPSDRGKKKTTELTGVIYEEPVAVAPVETVFSLSDNQAYGQVK